MQSLKIGLAVISQHPVDNLFCLPYQEAISSGVGCCPSIRLSTSMLLCMPKGDKPTGGERLLGRLTVADVVVAPIYKPTAPGPAATVQDHQLFDAVPIVEIERLTLQGQEVVVTAFPALERAASVAALQKESLFVFHPWGSHAELGGHVAEEASREQLKMLCPVIRVAGSSCEMMGLLPGHAKLVLGIVQQEGDGAWGREQSWHGEEL